MSGRDSIRRAGLLCGAAAIGLLAYGGVARAEQAQFNIPPQSLASALNTFGEQSHLAVMFKPGMAASKQSSGVSGAADVEVALNQVLAGTGLSYQRDGGTFLIVAGESEGGNVVQELVVTAQKKSENIQVVPIAISAFTQQDLTTRQVAGGPDLMTQVPNMTFTKTNFSSYSIQIRGIGTQAISATTDAAVAVAFNNTPFIRNRFFEQEFYDLERVEVLRGPQGTLYGRNATAGVVNILSAKPSFQYEAKASADVGNYSSKRLEGMVNIPLVEDKVALRLAGAWTKRDGYDVNSITGNNIDGRDLWSTRVSLRFEPTDGIRANLIWEHFQEDDDRLRSGKQLCKTDEITNVGGIPTTHYQTLPEQGQQLLFAGVQGTFSQGCAPESLYSPNSFQTPNGISLPYYLPLGAVFLPTALDDPYVSRTQSTDLRSIESTVDPEYRAKSDLGELQVSVDIGNGLTLASETAYSADFLFSLEDFNRFNTAPGAWAPTAYRDGVITPGPNGGVFCDPQLGCTDRLVAVDLSTAKSRQFSQEFRLSSDFDGPLNFSLGANFLRYDTEDKYYVFINSLSIISAISPFGSTISSIPYVGGVTTNIECIRSGYAPGYPNRVYQVPGCTYIDPNPIDSLNDQGHNYFLSKNPYKLISYAVFGEAYYNITETLKLTGGLRFTVDKKEAPRIPSWLLASQSVGYPVAEVVRQEWREPTGRVALDWKPALSFTNQTLLYASYAHGYKAGGANPPGLVNVYYASAIAAQELSDQSATRPKTFDPEFVDAFELGTKNTFLDGRATLNLSAFYYDYKGYQISQIVDRSAYNLNFDAKVWGAEIEADWRPLKNLRLGFKGGYENTRVADGSKAVDLMDRTAGDPNWVINKPFPTAASNCIFPVSLFVGEDPDTGDPFLHNLGGKGGGNPGGCEIAYQMGLDPLTQLPYVPNPTVSNGSFLAYHPGYPGFNPATAPNHGEGIDKDLSGNELPNAPHFTATITADYTIPLPHDWLATLHADLYYQSEAWTRIFNTEGYDKLKAYNNINVAAIFSNEAAGWRVMAYVKNVLDRDSITGAFLNSDDTGLTTNVFLTEPRLFGVRVTKDFTGGPLLGSFGARRKADGPYPFTIELGAQIQHQSAPNEVYHPDFLASFPSALNLSGKQAESLDWGDGRDIKLTYAPSGGWRVSLGARFGRANGGGRTLVQGESFLTCTVSAPCEEEPAQQSVFTNYGATELADKEKHVLIDFLVGRDMGIGFAGSTGSTFSLGLRYADLRSKTNVRLYGTPDWDVPEENFIKYRAQHHEYDASMQADRTFKGVGPVLSWEASKRLFGGEDLGHVDLDWSVSGGVLFGKQKTTGDGVETGAYYSQKYSEFPNTPLETSSKPFALHRTKSVIAPTLGAGLGLSYRIDRVNVGVGYRWERYFNAIDGGIATRKTYDRTIDGPYLKVSVGFGG